MISGCIMLAVGGAVGCSFSCPEPRRKGRNEVSSRPQTPCDPAGSRVYVSIRRRINLKYLPLEKIPKRHILGEYD